MVFLMDEKTKYEIRLDVINDIRLALTDLEIRFFQEFIKNTRRIENERKNKKIDKSEVD